jgi:hypothetical protein
MGYRQAQWFGWVYYLVVAHDEPPRDGEAEPTAQREHFVCERAQASEGG